MHLCDDTIQRDNISAGVGVIPKRNYFKFAQYAHNLEEAGADMILLACSTFNYAAELGRPMIDIPIMQIDRPMMELAVRQGTRVGMRRRWPPRSLSERLLRIVAASRRSRGITTVLREEAFPGNSKRRCRHPHACSWKRSTSSPGRWMSSSWRSYPCPRWRRN